MYTDIAQSINVRYFGSLRDGVWQRRPRAVAGLEERGKGEGDGDWRREGRLWWSDGEGGKR